MNISSYINFVDSLEKDPFVILSELTPQKVHLWHMASALLGEVAELSKGVRLGDRENIIEESGDCLFYMFALTPLWNPNNRPPFLAPCGPLIELAGELFDRVKKHVVYGKPLTTGAGTGVSEILWDIYRSIENGLLSAGSSVEEAIAINVEKLQRKYPNSRYTDADAVARADKPDEKENP